MRVVLATDAIFPPLTGIGRYALELATRLPDCPQIEQLRYLGMWRWVGQPPADEPAQRDRVEAMTSTGPRLARLRASMAGKPWAVTAFGVVSEVWRGHLLRAGRGAVYHSPNYFLAPYDGPSVATVHDLSITRFPETHPAARRRYFDIAFERSLRRATALITDSEAVRQEVMHDYGMAPERITAVHLGVDPAFHPRPAHAIEPLLRRWGLQAGSYLLSVSTLEPRKRLEQLITAYAQLDAQTRQRCPLVLTGSPGWLHERIDALIEQGRAAGWLRYLGYVPQADLPALYAGARAFAMVSIYEGFGLPLLEAMASGVPVLTSDRSCMPEVAGGAALLTDPDDVHAIADGLRRVLHDDAWRAAAVPSGLARARLLTWERCVEQTLAVYQRAADAA